MFSDPVISTCFYTDYVQGATRTRTEKKGGRKDESPIREQKEKGDGEKEKSELI